MIEPII